MFGVADAHSVRVATCDSWNLRNDKGILSFRNDCIAFAKITWKKEQFNQKEIHWLAYRESCKDVACFLQLERVIGLKKIKNLFEKGEELWLNKQWGQNHIMGR